MILYLQFPSLGMNKCLEEEEEEENKITPPTVFIPN